MFFLQEVQSKHEYQHGSILALVMTLVVAFDFVCINIGGQVNNPLHLQSFA